MKFGRWDKWRKLIAFLLSVIMVFTLFVGCGHRSRTEPKSDESTQNRDDSETGNTATISEDEIRAASLEDAVDPAEIIDTYNVVLVLDNSGSIERNDPYGLAFTAPRLFLESMYAGDANPDRTEGAKHTRVNVITYNDTVNPFFGELYTLDDARTVERLCETLQDTRGGPGTHDNALGDALLKAVEMLPVLENQMPPGPGPMGGPPGMMGGREQNLIFLFTDGYSTGGVEQMSYQESPFTQASVTTGPTLQMLSSPGMTPDVQQETVMPNFGGRTQQPLERALRAAKQRQCEIIVLGLNMDGSLDSYWEEFKKIANYTQLQMEPPPPPPDGSGAGPQMNPFPGGMGPGWMSEMSPEQMPPVPPGPPPPMMVNRIGGGMFNSTDADGRVNYWEAKTLMEAQQFYIQAASAMLQGTGVNTPKSHLGENGTNEYEFVVNGNGISAVVFYLISSDRSGVFAEDLVDPSGTHWATELQDGSGGGDSKTTSWDKNHRVRKNWYSGCCVITFLDPLPGTWHMKAHTGSRDLSQFSVYMTQVGGVDLQISFKQDERFADDGKIFVRAKYQGQYMSEEFYKEAVGTCDVMPPSPDMMGMPDPWMSGESDGAVMQGNTFDMENPPMPPGQMGGPLSLTYDPASNAMTADYRAAFPGSYMVNVNLNVSSVEYTSSGTVTFVPRPNMDIAIRKKGKSIPLVPELTDSWKDSISLEIVDWTVKPRGLLKVERDKRNDQKLIVEGLEDGTGTLEVMLRGTVENMPNTITMTVTYPVTIGRVRD